LPGCAASRAAELYRAHAGVLILALLLTGMVEFGFLLNNYLHVLDGSREAARLPVFRPLYS